MHVPETRYARSHDGAFIAWQAFGTGPLDLLWISPWFSHLEALWEFPPIQRFYREMAAFARVIMLDQRGIGLSDKTKGMPDLETRMDDIRAVLDAAGSERTVLWGAGADGGALCAMFTATYPERVRALAFWNATARTAWAPEYPWGDTQESADRWQELLGRGWGLEEHTAEIMAKGGVPSLTGDPETVRWMARVSRLMGSPGDVLAFDRMWMGIDFRAILPAIHAPVVCIYPDDLAGNDACEYVASQIAGATSVVLPAGDFTPWPTNTVAAVAALRQFVDAVQAVEAELDRVLATVLFTDIVNSTATAAGMGDARWREVVERHDQLARAMVSRYRGTFVRGTGDGMLATFDGPARAVRCAQAFAQAVRPLGVEVRAGAHTGEIEHAGNDLAGIAVHTAARVAGMAGPSEVWASSTVKDLTAGSGLAFEDRGDHELKGVPDRWRLYRVVAGS